MTQMGLLRGEAPTWTVAGCCRKGRRFVGFGELGCGGGADPPGGKRLELSETPSSRCGVGVWTCFLKGALAGKLSHGRAPAQ